MATFKSNAYYGGVPFRPVADQPFQITSSVLIPNGTSLALNDVIKFFKIGANVRILDVTLAVSDLDTGSTIVLDVGYSAAVASDVPDFFVDGSTIGQAGGVVRVENGGDDPFADGAFNPLTETIDIEALVQVAPAGNPTTDRYLTLTVSGQFVSRTTSEVPYVYADRYTAAGVGSI